jgi:peroxiredoxin Q/BCP
VVLAFYPGDFTAVCTRQFCAYRDDSAKLGELDAVVFGISPQDIESHRRWTADNSLTVPLLVDPGMAVAKAYGVAGPGFTRRAVVIVDPDGVIREHKVHRIGLSFEDAEWIAGALARARGL